MSDETTSDEIPLHVEHSIFRPDALRSFTERHAKAVLPRSPVPGWAVAALWVVLVLAALGGVAAWLAATAVIHP